MICCLLRAAELEVIDAAECYIKSPPRSAERGGVVNRMKSAVNQLRRMQDGAPQPTPCPYCSWRVKT